MSNGPVVNYSTQIDAGKTVGEMQQMLASHGASRIAVDYEGGSPAGLTFALQTQYGPKVFSLPVDIDAMHALLVEKDKKGLLKSGAKAVRSSRVQAERVAWRIMKDWLAAQLSLIESRMVPLDQVMLPYLRVSEDRTLYQNYVEQERFALQAAASNASGEMGSL